MMSRKAEAKRQMKENKRLWCCIFLCSDELGFLRDDIDGLWSPAPPMESLWANWKGTNERVIRLAHSGI